MKPLFKKAMLLNMMLIGYGSSSVATTDFKTKINQITYVTKEDLENLWFLPNELTLSNKKGQLRYLEPGEQVQVIKHEEDNSISFTTFDDYSVRIMGNGIQNPRNTVVGDRKR